jgi:hypothetical protein
MAGWIKALSIRRPTNNPGRDPEGRKTKRSDHLNSPSIGSRLANVKGDVQWIL